MCISILTLALNLYLLVLVVWQVYQSDQSRSSMLTAPASQRNTVFEHLNHGLEPVGHDVHLIIIIIILSKALDIFLLVIVFWQVYQSDQSRSSMLTAPARNTDFEHLNHRLEPVGHDVHLIIIISILIIALKHIHQSHNYNPSPTTSLMVRGEINTN